MNEKRRYIMTKLFNILDNECTFINDEDYRVLISEYYEIIRKYEE
ncbi:hypothetical protein Bint_1984 [Brachyspira intermedia PWS/A]|uniref:Uncharacterized protein n=1 Tax=Brachyspira intermedia (strain ATCC 51140 / PWS/A) TaxID=1045858 RepID=G0EKL4_BRAIP|nr:hypothetical protein Bint_1984 [Brachyspira intermedia PWS/A]